MSLIDKSKRFPKILEIFNKRYENKDISDKCYEITLVRSLMIYFIYSESADERQKKKYKITFEEIAQEFKMERTSVVRAYHRIKACLEDVRVLESFNEKQRRTFKIFFFLFNKL